MMGRARLKGGGAERGGVVSSQLDFPVHSAEAYVVEPADVWTSRVSAKDKERVPKVTQVMGEPTWVSGPNDEAMLVSGDLGREDARYEAAAALSAADYLKNLDRDGITGAVLYPTTGRRAYGSMRGEDLSITVRAYNDWVLEYCAAAKGRLKAMAMLNIEDTSEAVAEIERVAKAGAAGVLVPLMPHVDRNCYDNPRYEPMWQALAAAGIPVSLCSGTFKPAGGGGGGGDKAKPARGIARPGDVNPKKPGEKPAEAAAKPNGAKPDGAKPDGEGKPPMSERRRRGAFSIHALSDDDKLHPLIYKSNEIFYTRLNVYSMLFAGTFARYPNLKLIVAGFEASWLPYTKMRSDEQYEVRPERAGSEVKSTETFDHYGLFPEAQGFTFPKGTNPSDHLSSNVLVTFNDDRLAVRHRELVGVNNLLWGSLHPRGAASGKAAGAVLREQLEGVPQPEAKQIAGANAKTLYHF